MASLKQRGEPRVMIRVHVRDENTQDVTQGIVALVRTKAASKLAPRSFAAVEKYRTFSRNLHQCTANCRNVF
jgi:hypothetical protein